MVVELDAEYVRQHVGASIGTRVLLAISDTGVGMDAATQARIFEPYFTTKGRKGTGIGLATVYGICKQSGGDIWVYSEAGKGTTFKIYLPICETAIAAPAARRDARERTTTGSETLVLVENDDPIRRVTARILRSQGYAVLEAVSAEEALLIEPAMLKSAAMLITDLVLPGRSGRELAEALRASYPSLRVLYMSGHTEHAVVRHGALDPQVDFLPKPFAPTALVQRVRSMLDAPADSGQPEYHHERGSSRH
jgi:CheY-like chemotaxis protein